MEMIAGIFERDTEADRAMAWLLSEGFRKNELCMLAANQKRSTRAKGFTDKETKRYEDDIKHGKAVILVHAENTRKTDIARAVLKISGATTKAA